MKTEEEKIRQILKRGMQQPSPGFSARVMHQITEMQKDPQARISPHTPTALKEWPLETASINTVLKPLAWAFGVVAMFAIILSLMLEIDFGFLQEQALSSLSIQQMINIIFSLISFWVLILLRPWIKKRVYHLSGA